MLGSLLSSLLLTEAVGISVGLEIEGANRHDIKLVGDTLLSVVQTIEDKMLQHLVTGKEQVFCMDGGYDYDPARGIAIVFGYFVYTAHIRPRDERVQSEQVGKKAQRWVVKRTHSWINRYRCLLVGWEKEGTKLSRYDVLSLRARHLKEMPIWIDSKGKFAENYIKLPWLCY